MKRRSLVLTSLASAPLVLALGCTGDDGGNAEGVGSADSGTANQPDDGNDEPDDGGEQPDDGDDTMPPTDGTPDTGNTSDPDTGDTGMPDTGDTGDDTGVPACPYTAVDGDPDLGLELVADGFDRPVLAIGDPAQPDRLFVVEQGGAVRVLEPGMTSAPATAFLEVGSANAGSPILGPESGTLGFAFHPDWPGDGRVYISYNPPTGATVIEEYTVDAADSSQVDPASAREIIALPQPAGNHNGGMIAFGPDGYLYIGMGDGGGGGDQFNTGRNLDVVFAKMLRIGVEPDGTMDNPVAYPGAANLGPFDYTLPADNPGVDGSQPWPAEAFAIGLRNPWRFAFDPDNGDLYVGDVGQENWEEIDIVSLGGDYGWSDMEADNCFGGGGCGTGAGPNVANGDGLIAPIAEYGGPGRESITGGAVYRSCEVPNWSGIYVYGDYVDETVSALRWDGTTTTDLGVLGSLGEPIIGNGWNAWGDVFLTTVEGSAGAPHGTGKVYRVAPQP